MTKQPQISDTEFLDFHYLLGLMPPLHAVPEYSWLPELFSIIGHEKLILLSKYAGGETIKIPTLSQLSDSVDALQWFYDVQLAKTHQLTEVPPHLHELYRKIIEVYNASINQTHNTSAK